MDELKNKIKALVLSKEATRCVLKLVWLPNFIEEVLDKGELEFYVDPGQLTIEQLKVLQEYGADVQAISLFPFAPPSKYYVDLGSIITERKKIPQK